MGPRWTGEWDCRGLRIILSGGERAGEKNPRLYCNTVGYVKYMYCIISFVSLAIVISMSLFTFNTELDTILLIFHILIAVKSFKTKAIGLYF